MAIDPSQLRAKFSRGELETLLTHFGFQCYDHESADDLAIALADHMNTEGIALDALTLPDGSGAKQ